MTKFIAIDYGLVRKDAITCLERAGGTYPWNGKKHHDIEIHLQGTKVRLEFDSELERRIEFDRIADELKRKDCSDD